MKSLSFYLVLILIFIGMSISGFQCGSPDFTGGKVHEQNKNYTGAVELYEKEVSKNPANHEAWFRLGRIRGEQLHDYKGMNEAFNQASKLSKTYNAEIFGWRYKFWAEHINRGVTAMKSATPDSVKYYDIAAEEYKGAINIWPDTVVTYLYLAAAYRGKGDTENLIECYKKAWTIGQDRSSYKEIGRIRVGQGLEKKNQFKNENADQLKIQKDVEEIEKGNYRSDITRNFGSPDLQRKDKKNPKREDWIYNKFGITLTFEGERLVNKKIDKKYEYHIDSTKYYQAIADFNQAIDIFEQIKKIDPRDNENLNMLLQAYYEAGRTQEATKTFKLAVENDPGNKMNHYILGLLYRSLDDYDSAISEFTEATKIDPNFGDAFFDIGATYYNWGVKMKKVAQEQGDESTEYKKKFKDALPWMEKVAEMKIAKAQEAAATSGQEFYAEISRDDAKVWDTLGTIYALLGQADKATKALDEADKIRKTGK
jgi:tetratricopeptide (TPR) repeat protein